MSLASLSHKRLACESETWAMAEALPYAGDERKCVVCVYVHVNSCEYVCMVLESNMD